MIFVLEFRPREAAADGAWCPSGQAKAIHLNQADAAQEAAFRNAEDRALEWRVGCYVRED